MSPMKWIMLNILTQSSIIQLMSFQSMKKPYNNTKTNPKVYTNKLSWKW